MNIRLFMLTAAGAVTIALNVHSADAPGTPVTLIPNTAITAPASTPAPATGTTAATQPVQSKPTTADLRDGTKIEISDDNTVTIINSDGTRNIAPDGILTLKDQTTFDVKDGKRVNY